MPTLFNSNKFYTGALSTINLVPTRLTNMDLKLNEGVIIYADSGNVATVYIGNSNVTAGSSDGTDGFPIPPDKALLVKIDNPNKVFCVVPSGFSSHRVHWMTT